MFGQFFRGPFIFAGPLFRGGFALKGDTQTNAERCEKSVTKKVKEVELVMNP